MKNLKLALLLLALLALVIFVGTLTPAAQEKKETDKNTRTLTGCLQKSTDPGEFHLLAKDGSKWDIKSDNVKLAGHVGHTVTVVGVVANPTAHGMKEDVKGAVDKGSTETGDLTVTSLEMVSDSCK